jgi:retron-type reverse transcriptase
MRRTTIRLADVAAFDNVVLAAYRAARSKHTRQDVRRFFSDFDKNISLLSEKILGGSAPVGCYREFVIHDPKRRTIHAACFEDRVFHHALMHFVGPVLDGALLPNTFACRQGKGHHAAIARVRDLLLRYPWYVKIDIAQYFPAIDHTLLLALLLRKFKGVGIDQLFSRILASYVSKPGKGLPIGALTSQYFANYYLDGADRFVSALDGVQGYLRYMDDMIWCCKTKAAAVAALNAATHYLEAERFLSVKPDVEINRSTHGVTFCGYRVKHGQILLTRRRKNRYRVLRQKCETAYSGEVIDAVQLQQRYDAVRAITLPANATSWRRKELLRHPAIEV